MKKELIPFINNLDFRHEVEDLGPFNFDKADDYPDFMAPLAKKIQAEKQSIGIIIGGSGEGEAMVVNRFKGVRATVFYGEHTPVQYVDMTMRPSKDPYEIVRLGRMHNDANIISIGARFATSAEAKMAVQLFIETKFSGDERHVRRINKIDSLS